MYKIEKNVPRQNPYVGFRPRLVGYKYPFDQMAVGDSFLIPLVERHICRSAASAFSDAAWRRAKDEPKIKWSMCRANDDSYRIWRIA
jgi:hypothetical protein